MNNKEAKENSITPSQYFDYIKGAKNTITTDELKNSYGYFIQLAEKYNKLGQVESMKRLSFLVDTLLKEEKIIEMGITTYVYKDVIEDYIVNVADKTVKIIELSRYMREIPDEFVEIIEKTKEYFDDFFVVFTDYTGKETRKVEKERRDKDPILFGVFKNRSNVADRFYFIGDWVDEYCDLTLDKMIDQYKNKKNLTLTNEIKIPKTSEELVNIIKGYEISQKGEDGEIISPIDNSPLRVSNYVPSVNAPKKTFFDRIRTVLKI